MSYNTEALILKTMDTAGQLPDPATCNGRVHLLVSAGAGSVVWSSTGSLPFTEGGANVASLTIPKGHMRIVQSNGVRWSVAPSINGRIVWSGTKVTPANGIVTFDFPAGLFSAPPVVSIGLQGGSSATVEGRVTSLSASSCTVAVQGSALISILGISVLAAVTPTQGVTVHLIATASG